MNGQLLSFALCAVQRRQIKLDLCSNFGSKLQLKRVYGGGKKAAIM
jgi:hypothetical protein